MLLNTNENTFHSYLKNKTFLLLISLFIICWFYFFFTTRDFTDWWLENILVIAFFIWLMATQKKFRFSNTSLLFIFLFLLFHIYGAQLAYTKNTLGEFFKHKWHLQRNPYDRIVHFNFGFLMAYPIMDYLNSKYKTPYKYLGILTSMIILCLATIFELVEWAVAACTDSATGETYVATQGDVWDAHKDIILAVIGSMIMISFVKTKFKINTNEVLNKEILILM